MDLNATPEDIEYTTDDGVDQIDEPPLDENLSKGNCEPHFGMVFDTLEASEVFWNKYGRVCGFSTKVRSSEKSKVNADLVIGKDFACRKEGVKANDDRCIGSKKRVNVRCQCPCIMRVRLIKNTSNYRVTVFRKKHNHPLEDALTTPYLNSHRLITDNQAKSIDVAIAAGLGPKTTHRYMSLQAGGSINVGFTTEEIKSYLRTKRQKHLELGEANTILEYFREKKRIFPSFFHDYQYDCEGKLTNIFWADSRMIADYQAFGDVIMFDTTFGTNKAKRPLGIFTGFNNHRQCVVFGGCLLFDETILSFAWVFKIFLECHGGKLPTAIFTDQDVAMKSALEIVMQNVRHCLCSWHILQNATKNLAGKLRGDIDSFLKDLNCCMFMNCEVEEFEQMWKKMAEKYNIAENNWLVGLYDRKLQWSVAYRMNIFSAGVRSTQLVEGANANIKRELGTCITMSKFFQGFDYFLDGVRERETKSDVKSRQSFPHVPVLHSRLLHHAARVYTPGMFVRFNEQFDKMHIIRLDYMNIIEGPHIRIAFDAERTFKIVFNPLSLTISCSCCMFEMHGYVCAHILRVFDVCGIHEIPDKYIMKRWTRQARSGFAVVKNPIPELSDPEKIAMMMSNFNRLAYRTKGKSLFVDRIMKFIISEEEFIDKTDISNENSSIPPNIASEPDCRVTGLKEKQGTKGRNKKRVLSCLEKSKRSKNVQKKQKSSIDQPSSQVSTEDQLDIEAGANLLLKL